MAIDTEVRRLMDRVSAVARSLRSDCSSSILFRGDRQACANAADQADAFLDGGARRLLAQAEAGDTDARRRLVEGLQRIEKALTGAFTEISAGANVGDLVEDIVDDVKEATKSYLPWVIGGIAAVLVAAIALR